MVAAVAAAAVLAGGCEEQESPYPTVTSLYEAVGGAEWCDDDLRVTFEPFIGNCGDPTGDSRVVLGVGEGGDELRESIASARDLLVDDGQLLLVPDDPDAPGAWQLRSRDRDLLEEAQTAIGGVLLDDEAAVAEWLAR